MNLKYWKYRIANLRKDLRVLFLTATISVLLIDLWLINVAEWFPYGAELGALYYKICLAYITGFIFYFINVHLESEKTKVKTFKYIHNKHVKIRRLCETLIISLRRASQVPQGKQFDSIEKELEYLCKNINPQNPFVVAGWYNITFDHWFKAIDFIEKENKELTRDLLFVRESIKSDIIIILTDIEECISNYINLSHGQPLGNTDLETYSAGIIQYKRLCDKLDEIMRDKYKYYQVEYQDSFRKKNNKK
ncbi:hypothetical protein [Jeotgalibacillus campisalis]|uniref:Uncharacterized protein n=1 Tax=Jeotgalibacillus campisalis TaxID=220754 RepID=A0A0C2RPU9_9BACL|nr:hypothetical protein [Jeotgalibacillus campisalis]KIL43784.1 hypothetical protein KR50_33040 [Jeotgalibacillus campisalis]